jgi:alpha-L-fucosidase
MQSRQDRLQWYLDAKFGLFIHWGPYSVAGVEASWPIMAPDLAAVAFGQHPTISEADYVALPAQFNPVDFDARAWARIAQRVGIKYVVITAKHHDGFCMFDAPGTDYKITRTPFGRDVCSELAEACAEAGLRLCFYYSPPDMHHAGYRNTARPARVNWLGEPKRQDWASYLDYMEEHIRTLLTGYGDVGAIWFDGLASHDKYDPPRFHRLIQELSPATLVNDRLGTPYDFITPEQFIPHKGIPVKWVDSDPPEMTDGLFRLLLFLLKVPGLKHLMHRLARRYAQGDLELMQIPTAPHPSQDEFQPWETCMTLNETWAHNPTDRSYKPAKDLIRNLVRVASRGGNYLLNVGPTPLGTFPPEAVERLEAIGDWMAVNANAIHGTTYGPVQDLAWARTTAKDGIIYMHVFDWPPEGRISIEGLEAQVSMVSLLAGGESLPFQQSDGRLTFEVPGQVPDPHVSVLAIRTR